MNNNLPQLPGAADGTTAPSVNPTELMDLFGGLEQTMVDNLAPEAVREALLAGYGIDADHATSGTSIDLNAWRQRTNWQDRMKVYAKAIISETVFDYFIEDNVELKEEELEFMAPDLDDFLETN